MFGQSLFVLGKSRHKIFGVLEGFCHHQTAVVGNQLDAHLFEIDRVCKHPVNLLQHSRDVLRQNGIADGKQRIGNGKPCALPHLLDGDLLRAAAADIQQRKCIAHSAFGKPSNQLGSRQLNVDIFPLADLDDPLGNDLRTDALKVKPLAAGEDGSGNLVDLGGRQDEDDVLGRLLHDFEQSVEGAGAEHMGFVDDVNAVVCDSRGEVCLLAQLADVVHAVVAGSVNLGDVEDGAVVDAAADVTDPTGIAVLLMGTVDRLGDDFGAGGLAGAAGAGEEIGVTDASAGNLLLEHRSDVLLSYDLVKVFGTIFSVQCLIHPADPPVQ